MHHIRTTQFGAMSLTNSKTTYRSGFAPLLPGVFVAPVPFCSHCRVHVRPTTTTRAVLRLLNHSLSLS